MNATLIIILLLEYVIPLLLSVTEKSDLIVDHKNDIVLSCKFNRSVHVVMEM